ncbi:hypothetical protein SASPL_157069 [Salvia splendens]|uniref:Myotubularin phosphatase domain-containing protein n=1 Tax=Salvia splendens TaxID=180675 RepID=A0A8X8YUX2_SALSN|nr:hypothetical protein SASPL_157069 [Salvia splendens]
MVKHLNLETRDHPNPYTIGWLKKEVKIKITKQCWLPLSLGKHYRSNVLCDVIDMDACHVLLGRPWQYDVNITHKGRDNWYSFIWNKRKIIILPDKIPNITSKVEEKSMLTINQNSKEFAQDLKESKQLADKKKREMTFKVGDKVMVYLRKERLPTKLVELAKSCTLVQMIVFVTMLAFSIADGPYVFLVDLVDSALSCRFGNFFCNSEKERQQAGIYDACGCLWVYLADLRASDRSSGHHNHFYDASKVQGPLLPPAAALAPTLWPQFHLRWACPSEAQAGEIEAHCRNMAEKISELQKEKDIAEAKLRETTSTVASLTDELRNEKLSSSSVRDWARSAKKENVAIKRAIQSLGCKVQFSEDGDCIVGIENIAAEIPQKSLFSIEDMQSSLYMQSDEKPDSLVYVTREEDEDGDSINPINQVCESLCPLRTREGGCRWPEAGCAQFGSQFVGMKENFDAFDRLSIYDSYFQSQ